MNIDLKATNLDLTEPLKDYVFEKIGGLERYLIQASQGEEIKASVEVARTTRHHHKGDVFYAEVTIFLPGQTLRAEAVEGDVRKAVDAAKEKLKEEIERHKRKYETD